MADISEHFTADRRNPEISRREFFATAAIAAAFIAALKEGQLNKNEESNELLDPLVTYKIALRDVDRGILRLIKDTFDLTEEEALRYIGGGNIKNNTAISEGRRETDIREGDILELPRP